MKVGWNEAKNSEQSGCLLCSRVRGPVNLAGPLKILAKVWLHTNLEKGVPLPSKLAWLRTLFLEP
jgi:hypothetical protein